MISTQTKMLMYRINFTPEALGLMTPAQQQKLKNQAAEQVVARIYVFVDLSLPEGYLGLQINYASGSTIYGGMDKEGVIST